MNNSKNEAYQQKILQLVLREQAAEASKQTVIRQNDSLKGQIVALRREYEQKITQVKENAESDLSKAQMEIRLAKMSKISEVQRNQDLQRQLNEQYNMVADLVSKKQKVDEQLKRVRKDVDQYKLQLAKKSQACISLQQKCQKYEQSIRQLSLLTSSNETQIDQLARQKGNLQKTNSKLSSQVLELRQLFEETKGKLQILRSEDQIKTKAKLEKQQQFIRYQQKIQQVSRQNSILRDRKKKLEEDLKLIEQQKEQLQETLKRSQKASKKNKESISQQQSRIKQLQQQNAVISEKYRNLERSFKSAKRQIEQLQQSLQALQQSKNSQYTKYKKWESITKAQKESLLQKEDEVQQLTQSVNNLKKECQASQKSSFELTLQLQKVTKQNKYLSEQYQQQQQKRIILENQKDKSLSIVIKQKDILNKANFKLLQLLELKDSAITSILQGIEKNSDKININTVLQGQQLMKQIRQGDRQRLKNGKQRIKMLQEWIKARR